jgi:2-furoyl-CoA dehydrogenase 2Fe-2S iron sulfur subunit
MSRLQAGRRHTVRFTLNGKPCVGEVEPRLLLTDFLRHQIGSTGTHVGCEHGVAPSADRLGILQAALKRNHALQCGFCTAGILMSLDSFLRQHKRPDEEDIRDLLSGHLCRCTGYAPIVRAAMQAAEELVDQNQEKTNA